MPYIQVPAAVVALAFELNIAQSENKKGPPKRAFAVVEYHVSIGFGL